MRKIQSPLFSSLSLLTAWTLVLGLVSGRPELFFVSVPLVVAILFAGKPVTASHLRLTASVSSTRLVEGDELEIVATVTARKSMPVVEIILPLPGTFTSAKYNRHFVTSLRPGESSEWTIRVRSVGRNRCKFGPFPVRLSNYSGLHVEEATVGSTTEINTYARIPRIRRLPRPGRTRSSFGNYVSEQFGGGLEPGEIRPFASGDRVRQVNWPASLRLGRLYVTQFLQERNADVVFLLDTLAESGARPNSSLDVSIRAVAGLASAYIARKDRVGLIEFGGFLRWLKPAAGRRQLETLLEAMLPATPIFTYTTRTLDFVPAAALPRQALVIAVSPLIDDRFVKAMINLAGRGYALLLIAVSPIELTRCALPASHLTEVACRLWTLEFRNRLQELRGNGLNIVEWQAEEPLEIALASVDRRAVPGGHAA